ncbi:hypothetical protein H6P81_021322 [Aristolochia fimbriata]|uniref:Uncharacterized protein n=1 Tax=Aristolochia fimbriata TaxID=158543 RepID=A0AAV7DQ77_ARIFI|nr:hypothetical protein H6P81_021322 [Aristolochia fimbriata]
MRDEPKAGLRCPTAANLEPTKGVGRLRQQDGGHGSRNPLRTGGRVQRLEEHRTPLRGVRCAGAPLKTGGPKVPPTPGRTHNRIRSPRQGKSAKWIRKFGKGLARGLGTGSQSPTRRAVGGLLEAAPRGRERVVAASPGTDRERPFGAFPGAEQPTQTGTDKGNPTA